MFKGVAQINLASNTIIETNGWKWYVLRHEYVMAFIWTIGIDSLILLTRKFKQVRNYREIHGFCVSFILLLTYLARYTGQENLPSVNPEEYNKVSNYKNKKNHWRFSDWLVIVMWSQFITGAALQVLRKLDKVYLKWI